MMKRNLIQILCLFMLATLHAQQYKLSNRFISRTISIESGVIRTDGVENRIAKKTMNIGRTNEFLLRFSNGTQFPGTAFELTNKDFVVVEHAYSKPEKNKKELRVLLKARNYDMTVQLRYVLGNNDFFIRKYLIINTQKKLCLEKVNVEDIETTDSLSFYTLNAINATGVWKPNLGQPVYDQSTAIFLGVEFPASINTGAMKRIECGYMHGNDLAVGENFQTYSAVVGVADEPEYLDEAFYNYINTIRRRPAHLQIQYNSWFDYGGNVDQQKFAESATIVHNELVKKRGCKPLNAYVIDDGWQNNVPQKEDRSVWMVNEKFDANFESQFRLLNGYNSKLGLWLSPGCFFGAQKMVPYFDKMGYDALMGKKLHSMSLAGSGYMQKLEDRILELTRLGVNYFKFDGLFGHLYIRNFELKGRGTAFMPQLLSDTITTDSPELNNAKYNDLKLYYLTSGTRNLMNLFNKMADVNPNVYIAITNGAYLSAWWLQYVDIVWLINASDGAAGDNRTAQLVYRDNIYHRIWNVENTKFPMNSVFNHEPKKTAADKESPEIFRDYLFMNLSRGTYFIELYLKTKSLTTADWYVLAEALKWAEANHSTFENVRMIGGRPSDKEVYGYAGWNAKKGYISLHNPSDKEQTYMLHTDRNTGFGKGKHKVKITFRLNKNDFDQQPYLEANKTYPVRLKPGEIFMISY